MARWRVTAVLAAFAVLAVAGCVQQEAAAPAPPAATPAPLTSDQNFVDRAALGTGTEVELGRLARSRAVSPAVRAFANRIITDHTQAHARLTRAERSTHIGNAGAAASECTYRLVRPAIRPRLHARSNQKPSGSDPAVSGRGAERPRPAAAEIRQRHAADAVSRSPGSPGDRRPARRLIPAQRPSAARNLFPRRRGRPSSRACPEPAA